MGVGMAWGATPQFRFGDPVLGVLGWGGEGRKGLRRAGDPQEGFGNGCAKNPMGALGWHGRGPWGWEGHESPIVVMGMGAQRPHGGNPIPIP